MNNLKKLEKLTDIRIITAKEQKLRDGKIEKIMELCNKEASDYIDINMDFLIKRVDKALSEVVDYKGFKFKYKNFYGKGYEINHGVKTYFSIFADCRNIYCKSDSFYEVPSIKNSELITAKPLYCIKNHIKKQGISIQFKRNNIPIKKWIVKDDKTPYLRFIDLRRNVPVEVTNALKGRLSKYYDYVNIKKKRPYVTIIAISEKQKT